MSQVFIEFQGSVKFGRNSVMSLLLSPTHVQMVEGVCAKLVCGGDVVVVPWANIRSYTLPVEEEPAPAPPAPPIAQGVSKSKVKGKP
jgi:hypothetical protein